MTVAARPLRVTDLPVLALHNNAAYPNQAVTLDRCDHPADVHKSVWRLLGGGLLPFRTRRIWIGRQGMTLIGLASVRPRKGRFAWEIDTLLSTANADAYVLDLLDRAVAAAGAEGAGRLFLRVRVDSPLLAAARQHGFTVVTEETRFYAPAPLRSEASPPGGRRRTRADDLAIFRLYIQGVPQEVRWHTALSPLEWRAAEEPLGGQAHDWVLPADTDSGLRALVRLAADTADTRATLLTEGTPESARLALALALGLAPRLHHFHLLLPAYAVSEATAAVEAGLAPAESFMLLVRPIAQRARRLHLAEQPVEARVRPVLQ